MIYLFVHFLADLDLVFVCLLRENFMIEITQFNVQNENQIPARKHNTYFRLSRLRDKMQIYDL